MKTGFVNIVGNPNVGKSTLMNALVGERLSIVTSKAQTTRHRIMGIVNGSDFQIVYSDTPGILMPRYKMHRAMMQSVDTAFIDADVLLYVTDVIEKSDKHKHYIERLQQAEVSVIVAINKIDTTTPEDLERLAVQWHGDLPDACVIPVSALHNFNIDVLLKHLKELLPEGEPYYDRSQFTDRSLRFFACEIIREKILLNYHKEIPYSVEVVIDAFEESEEEYRIAATIYAERRSQQAILVGHQGQKIAHTGLMARMDMQKFFERKVFLHLRVKVNPDWRNSDKYLKQFGYLQ